MTKNIPFFPILHVFAPLNDVRAYIAWSWKTTLITWIFYADDIQLQIQVAPLGHTLILILFFFPFYADDIQLQIQVAPLGLTITLTLTTRLVGCEGYSKVMPK